MKTSLLPVLLIISLQLFAQSSDTLSSLYKNTAESIIGGNAKLGIGGYGEVHYNQPLKAGMRSNGTLDVHRIVMFMGYNFSPKTQFVTELEVEYAREIWIEQAFVQHKILPFLNFRAGLLLIPMGIINEYHEPTTFHGVERPVTDNRLSISTWREVGAGFSGNILPASLKYQAYVVGGLNGYDTKGQFNGSSGLREGRQKGSKAYVNTPCFTGKLEYYGLRNLNLGLSGYFGNSQSKLFSSIHKDSISQNLQADSSVVKISMLGFDTRYRMQAFEFRGQVYYTALGNTLQYNKFTSSGGKGNDLGKAMAGFYAEAAFNLLSFAGQCKSELLPFVRYEYMNTHHQVDSNTAKNDKYESKIITTGITYRLNRNAVIKSDLQFIKTAADSEFSKTANFGVGVMF